MKIEKLHEGMVIRNYKVLCEILDIPTKTGKSRQLQLQDFKRYFESYKEGNCIIIKKIYDDPLPKNEKRKFGNHKKYVDDIEKILLHKLNEDNISVIENNEKVFTTIELFRILSLVNSNFKDGFYNKEIILDKNKDLDKSNIYYFYSNVYFTLKNIVETALNNMQRRNIIKFNKVLYVCSSDDNGVAYREATDEEILLIDEVEKKAMKKMGLNSKRERFLYNKKVKFDKLVSKELSKSTNIDYYYTAYEIKVIEKSTESDEAIINIRKNLNGKIIKKLDTITNNLYENNKAYFGEAINFKGQKDFIEQQNYLIDTLIRNKL